MAAPPPPLVHFDIPEKITEIGYHFPIHSHPKGLEYVLVKSTVWVYVGRDGMVPHEYRSWYRHYHDGQREGSILEGDVPLYILEVAFGKGTADPKDGAVINAKDPKLEGDLDTPVYSAMDSSWSKEEGEIVEQEEEPDIEPEEEDPEEESEEESKEDPEEDLEYDPNED
ncbi:hypothetical protein ACJRO7_001132 [Eucalyptus globulus]|uniref:Uncharacterized protein n=1 Tax=Eucalyptus globulus TaxID=34317 RepID=A0ABD3LZV1_EUCGL